MGFEVAALKLIVGLGNPGERYARTRHNAGFWVINALAQRWNIRCGQKKFHALWGQGRVAGTNVILLKPQTFMNRSGQAVAGAARFFDIPDEDIFVIFDELALEPGRIRLRPRGSAGGHRGVKDIIAHLGNSGFPRLRIGIGRGPENAETSDYVLAVPTADELPLLHRAVEFGADAVEAWLREGMEAAMAEYNAKLLTEPQSQ